MAETTAFAENMKKARKAYRLTQEEAARRIGISRSNIGSYEERRCAPRLNDLIKICEVYGISDLYSFISDINFNVWDDTKPVIPAKSLIDKKYLAAPPKIRKAVEILLEIRDN